MNVEVKIHQALHGYDSGHRLIESSTELPRQAEKTLAVLSDLSGPSGVPGFESYLTGYPLVGTCFYALAQTWSATEQRRPGCVWTHTLLLTREVLEKLPDLRILCQLFRRPNERSKGFSAYEAEIVTKGDGGQNRRVHFDSSFCTSLLEALYGVEALPVLVPVDNASDYADLTLAVWSQQWVSLRRSFTFSTGSLSNRTLGNDAFQLQMVPHSQMRSIQRSLKNVVIVDKFHSQETTRPSPWLRQAVEDLDASDDSHWRHNLLEVSRGLPGERRFFPLAALSASWDEWSKKKNDTNVVADYLLRELYATHDCGHYVNLLAESCLASPEEEILGTDRIHLLEKLLSVDQISDSVPADKSLIEHARDFFSNQPDGAARLLSNLHQRHLTQLGEEVVKAVASEVASDFTADLITTFRKAMPVLVSLKPKIGTMPESWRGTRTQNYEVLDAIVHSRDESPDLWRGVTRAVLAARQDYLARPIVGHFGPDVLKIVLDWFNESRMQRPQSLAREWREILTAHKEATLLWLQGLQKPMRAATVGLISTYLDPDWDELKAVNRTKWLDSLETHGRDETREEIRDRVSAFVFAVGMHNDSPTDMKLLLATFDEVHEALLETRLDDEAWCWLSDQLPRLRFFNSWDRAERLRRGIIERFVDHEWPVSELVATAMSEETWSYLLGTCQKTKKGKRVFRELKNLLAEGNTDIPKEKRRILEDFDR